MSLRFQIDDRNATIKCLCLRRKCLIKKKLKVFLICSAGRFRLVRITQGREWMNELNNKPSTLGRSHRYNCSYQMLLRIYGLISLRSEIP